MCFAILIRKLVHSLHNQINRFIYCKPIKHFYIIKWTQKLQRIDHRNVVTITHNCCVQFLAARFTKSQMKEKKICVKSKYRIKNEIIVVLIIYYYYYVWGIVTV